MKILVTGGAGFIGSALVRYLIANTEHEVINVDKLTYAGNLASLSAVANNRRYTFSKTDICDQTLISDLLEKQRPNVIMHLAAESHVDRSIDGPGQFIQTNIIGTYTLLTCAHKYWAETLAKDPTFRFLHISTDEVYGSLSESDDPFSESTPYDPRSPYSASKASSDHLVNAWHHTYGLPTLMTNCSNNYGPYHFPEKLIPLTILNALAGKKLPVYGKGENIRDWLHVEDHVAALYKVVCRGKVGESYNIGGGNEIKNIDIVKLICTYMDELYPEKTFGSHLSLIEFVKDRPGHDFRYAIDHTKITRELGWSPSWRFEDGLRATIDWYIENQSWWQAILDKTYQGQRLGLDRK